MSNDVKFEVSAKTIKWAREKMVDAIQNMLDDPHWGDDEYAVDYVDEYRAVAKELGLDFDFVVKQCGTRFEIDRWNALLEYRKSRLTT